MELTAEIARELLTYNPDTGKLFWKERSAKYFNNPNYTKRWNTQWAGKEDLKSVIFWGELSVESLRNFYTWTDMHLT